MRAEPRRQKWDLVWASIFPAAFATWMLTMLIANGNGSGAQILGLLMFFALFLSVFTASVLLLCGGHGPRLLIVGRVLVCLQLLCLAAGVVLGVLMVVSGS